MKLAKEKEARYIMVHDWAKRPSDQLLKTML